MPAKINILSVGNLHRDASDYNHKYNHHHHHHHNNNNNNNNNNSNNNNNNNYKENL